MEYKLLTSEYSKTLSVHVSEYLEKGWTLYGSPSSTVTMNEYTKRTLFAQAITKEKYQE